MSELNLTALLRESGYISTSDAGQILGMTENANIRLTLIKGKVQRANVSGNGAGTGHLSLWKESEVRALAQNRLPKVSATTGVGGAENGGRLSSRIRELTKIVDGLSARISDLEKFKELF